MAGGSELPRDAAGTGDIAPATGEPLLRYILPSTPVATAAVDIGHVGIRIELFGAGELAVTAQRRGPVADPRAFRACTLTTLRSMARGLMVTGLGTDKPVISSAAGHRFTQTGHRWRAPNHITFAGTCSISFVQASECGAIMIAGDVGYSLNVTAAAAGGRAHEVSEPARGGWWGRHDQELASIGAVVLVAVPVAPGQLVGVE